MTRVLGQQSEDLSHVAHHMARIMDRMFRPHYPLGPPPPHWHPPVDVCELPDHYEVVVDLAGMKKEEIHVATEGTTLVIRGWREDPSPEGKVRLHQMEIEQGRFQRRVTLGADAACEETTARYHDGLLRILVPKK